MEKVALVGVDTLTETAGFLLFSNGSLFFSQLLTKSLPASLLGGRSLSFRSGVLSGGCLQELGGTAERKGTSQA